MSSGFHLCIFLFVTHIKCFLNQGAYRLVVPSWVSDVTVLFLVCLFFRCISCGFVSTVRTVQVYVQKKTRNEGTQLWFLFFIFFSEWVDFVCVRACMHAWVSCFALSSPGAFPGMTSRTQSNTCRKKEKDIYFTPRPLQVWFTLRWERWRQIWREASSTRVRCTLQLHSERFAFVTRFVNELARPANVLLLATCQKRLSAVETTPPAMSSKNIERRSWAFST